MSDNFKKFNQHYKDFPPEVILDDQGVRHIKETQLETKYGEGKCNCFEHPLDSDTWYHIGIPLTSDRIGVYRACKTCREPLVREIER